MLSINKSLIDKIFFINRFQPHKVKGDARPRNKTKKPHLTAEKLKQKAIAAGEVLDKVNYREPFNEMHQVRIYWALCSNIITFKLSTF